MPTLPPPPPPAPELAAPAPTLPALSHVTSSKRSERVDPGGEVSDFDKGDLEVKLRLGFSGNSLLPQTLVTAFFNWFELQANVDYGVYQREYLTLGIGAEAWLGRPWVPEAVSKLESDSGAELDWRSTARGIAVRGTAHYTWLSSFDPYAVVLVGPSLDTVYARRADRDDPGRVVHGRFLPRHRHDVRRRFGRYRWSCGRHGDGRRTT